MDPNALNWFDYNGDGITDAGFADTNQDGYWDVSAVDGNGDGYFEAYGYDTNFNGLYDTLALDSDLDGYLDSSGWDVNENGVVDHIAGPATGGQTVAVDEGLYPSYTTVGPSNGTSPQETLWNLPDAFTNPFTFLAIHEIVDSMNDTVSIQLLP